MLLSGHIRTYNYRDIYARITESQQTSIVVIYLYIDGHEHLVDMETRSVLEYVVRDARTVTAT